MGLIGSVLGYVNTGKAANTLSQGYLNAESGVLGASNSGQNQVNQTINNAANNVNTAGSNATSGVYDAANNCNQTIGACVTAANQGLGTTLSNQTTQLQPYLNAGAAGATQLQNYAASAPKFDFTPTQAQLEATPGYQFQLQQGKEGIVNTAAAQGLNNSGNTAKALDKYASDLASANYEQAFQNAQSQFQTNQNATLQNLGALTNAGLAASGQYNTAAQNAGNLQAANTVGGAAQQAANTVGAGTYAGNTATSLAEFLSNLQTQGSEYTGNLGLQGAINAGNLGVGAAGAQAGGDLGKSAVVSSGLASLGSLLAGL